METQKTLKFLRQVFNLKQSEVFPNRVRSSYTKLELEQQHLKINDIKDLSERYDITINDFFYLYYANSKEESIENTLHQIFANPAKRKETKNMIIELYKTMDITKDSTIHEITIYIALKNICSRYWKEIENITDSDIKIVIEKLLNSVFWGTLHYKIFLNISTYLNTEQIDLLLDKAYPISYYSKRPSELKSFASSTLMNIITVQLYDQKYQLAHKYIKIAQTIDTENTNYYYRLSIQYLKNLTIYLNTGNLNYYTKVYSFISLVSDIGDKETAKELQEEVEQLITKSKLTGGHYPANWIKES